MALCCICREAACALHCHYLLIILNELYKSIMPFLNFLVSLSIWSLIFFLIFVVCVYLFVLSHIRYIGLQLINRFTTL